MDDNCTPKLSYKSHFNKVTRLDQRDVTSQQQDVNTSAILNRRCCVVMNAFEITLNMDMKHTTCQNGLCMLFLDTSESYLHVHHNASKERQFSPPHHHNFFAFQTVAVCIPAATDSDDAYFFPY